MSIIPQTTKLTRKFTIPCVVIAPSLNNAKMHIPVYANKRPVAWTFTIIGLAFVSKITSSTEKFIRYFMFILREIIG